MDHPQVRQTGSGSNAGGDYVDVQVSWSKPEGPVNGYRLQYRSQRSDGGSTYWTDWFEIQHSGTSYNMRVFAGTTAMEFKVKAFNDGGEGPFSDTETFNYPST